MISVPKPRWKKENNRDIFKSPLNPIGELTVGLNRKWKLKELLTIKTTPSKSSSLFGRSGGAYGSTKNSNSRKCG
jgi:hypothetical protein